MPFFSARMPIVLASGSPRRQAFLRNLGLEFTVADSGREAEPGANVEPAAFARAAALAKARHAADSAPHAAVLGADTVVSLRGRIFGKPGDAARALDMLENLNNREHTVISACALLLPGGALHTCQASARVRFWNVPLAALRAYAHSQEPADKAGAYAIQGHGAFLVRQVRGSINAVIGLPLAELIELLLLHQVIRAHEV